MTDGEPDPTYGAQRSGLFTRLTQGEQLDPTEAEDWIGRWEAHAEAEGVSPTTVAFWDQAREWIAEQRAPKLDMGAEADDGQVYGG